MSIYFSQRFASLTPYTPGEQPRDMQYVKLNTNESPYPPSSGVLAAVERESRLLQLYSDPQCRDLVAMAAEKLGVAEEEIIFTNGSDEVLNFAFMAFCDEQTGAAFPDITYGFYEVFAQLNGVPYEKIPLKTDFSINVNDYIGLNKTIFIANPNAPTGLALPLSDIEKILAGNPDNIVVIDEAYVDFGGESAVSLIHKYENLLVTQTFSKSRSMAGARLGFGVGCKALIQDLNTVKYSTNPYNVNRLTLLLGEKTVEAEDYYREKCAAIQETRSWTSDELKKLGFTVLPSKANFLFAKSDRISGQKLYEELKRRGILVRHFTNPRITDFNRITIGTPEQMQIFINTVKEVLYENL